MIIINGRFLLHRVTGVERYAREIVSELDKIVSPGEVIIAVPPEVLTIPQYKNIEVKRVGRLHNRLWEHVSFLLFVKHKKGVSLNLCNVAPLISPGIVCIHDVKIKARPKDFSKLFLVWYNILLFNECKRARKIITVSKFSKKEICKYYKVESNRIVVIPNAWQHYSKVEYDENALKKYGLYKEQYYFSMCSLEPNKNFRWIAETALKHQDEIFAVAGSINRTVFSEGLGFECPKNMLLLGYVSDEEAKTLMRDSKAFIFPSFYEGFGIPPLEAISAGCKKVVVSDNEVMHEVFGSYVDYLDPFHPGSIISGQNNDASSLLSSYSWEKVSAPRLLEVIRNLDVKK